MYNKWFPEIDHLTLARYTKSDLLGVEIGTLWLHDFVVALGVEIGALWLNDFVVASGVPEIDHLTLTRYTKSDFPKSITSP